MNYLYVTNRQHLEIWHVSNTIIIKKLEISQPELSQPSGKSDRSLLERFFDWLQDLLVRLITAGVKATLNRLHGPKENFKVWLKQLWKLMRS